MILNHASSFKYIAFVITGIYIIQKTESKLLGLNKGDSCSGGSCQILTKCHVISDFKRYPPDICGFEGKMPIVCCPEEEEIPEEEERPESTESPLSEQIDLTTTSSTQHESDRTYPEAELTSYDIGSIARKKCKEYNWMIHEQKRLQIHRAKRDESPKFTHVIQGGTPSKPQDLTFMVLLGYGNKDSKSWECGGSLISEQWILSAAHCINHGRLGKAKWIRLGDLVIDTDKDNASTIDMGILEIIPHPKYGPEPALYNDIALFKFEYAIRHFNEYVAPICLETYVPHLDIKPIAAGWGTTGFGEAKSVALLQVELDWVATRTCREQYGTSRVLPTGIDPFTQICSGSPGKDTCTGDSGGPLFQIKDTQHLKSQIGITSFGRRCGSLPGVYTWVLDYIEWIERIVWPEEIKKPQQEYDLLI